MPYSLTEPVVLNPTLLKHTRADAEVLTKLHAAKRRFLQRMKEIDFKNYGLLCKYAIIATSIEIQIQTEWGFPADERFHKFWEVPHCKCDQESNEDRYNQLMNRCTPNYTNQNFQPEYRISNKCPVHGWPGFLDWWANWQR